MIGTSKTPSKALLYLVYRGLRLGKTKVNLGKAVDMEYIVFMKLSKKNGVSSSTAKLSGKNGEIHLRLGVVNIWLVMMQKLCWGKNKRQFLY